jgi:hypothetical protein
MRKIYGMTNFGTWGNNGPEFCSWKAWSDKITYGYDFEGWKDYTTLYNTVREACTGVPDWQALTDLYRATTYGARYSYVRKMRYDATLQILSTTLKQTSESAMWCHYSGKYSSSGLSDNSSNQGQQAQLIGIQQEFKCRSRGLMRMSPRLVHSWNFEE